MKPDLPDVFAALGLLLVCIGVGFYSVPAAFLVAGAVLTLLALWSTAAGSGPAPPPG